MIDEVEHRADARDDEIYDLKTFLAALRKDWRGFYGDLRKRNTLLAFDGFVVVTRWLDTVDVLTRPEAFAVPYREVMDAAVGPFMLARDAGVQNWRDKAALQALMVFDERAARELARQVASNALRARARAGRIDLCREVSRAVPLAIVKERLGFRAPDEDILAWSKALQRGMFYNLERDAEVRELCERAGLEMRNWIRRHLETLRPWGQVTGDDTVSRLLRLGAAGLAGLADEEIVSNIGGLLVGSIETTSAAILNATRVLLERDSVRERAFELARTRDPAFDAMVWEALRFYPVSTFLVRVCVAPTSLAPGTSRCQAVRPGDILIVAIGSAMFDEDMFPGADEFLPEGRPRYLHMGFGPHECLGRRLASAIVPATVAEILSLPGVHLLPDEEGRIDMDGPFPERFVVGFESESSMLRKDGGRP